MTPFKIYLEKQNITTSTEDTVNPDIYVSSIEAGMLVDPVNNYLKFNKRIINGDLLIHIHFPSILPFSPIGTLKRENKTHLTPEAMEQLSTILTTSTDIKKYHKQLIIDNNGISVIDIIGNVHLDKPAERFVIDLYYEKTHDKALFVYPNLAGDPLSLNQHVYVKEDAISKRDISPSSKEERLINLICGFYPGYFEIMYKEIFGE